MLAILWLITWATVGEAFYDDNVLYSSDDERYNSFETQRLVRDNFTRSLRSFARAYTPIAREAYEMTLQKAKTKLRNLKIFTYTGSAKDFEPAKGQSLPLNEAGKYCTMGKYTKVDCNHCTCVAGQLYMCTGMICHHDEPRSKSQLQTTCKEGSRRKVDSCNYCYCHNGLEICTINSCTNFHRENLLRTRKCRDGHVREVNCNQCFCRKGVEFCTLKLCFMTFKGKPHENLLRTRKCRDGDVREVNCNKCVCHKGTEYCTLKHCTKGKPHEKILRPKCREGAVRKIDACNSCYCNMGREYCENKQCVVERQLQNDECEEGSMFQKDSCNYCICQNGEYFCTINDCEQRYSSRTFLREYRSNDDLEKPRLCTIGDRYRVDACNYCYCNEYRERVCTHNKCHLQQKVEPTYDLNTTNSRCVIGARFRKGVCNYCYCNYDRKLICSNNKCRRFSLANYLRNKKYRRMFLRYTWTPAPKYCNPDERYRIDNCNYCYCNEKRQRVCDDKICDPKIIDTRYPKNRPRRGCHIGARFKKGKCQICYCAIDRSIRCFVKQSLCPNLLMGSNTTTLPTTRTTKTTKTTTSTTRKPLPSQPPKNASYYYYRRNKKTCTEGSRRQVDACNYCVCIIGAEFCTGRFCSNDTMKPIELSEPECVVGKPVTAPNLCNLCICLNSDILCTNNPCSARRLSLLSVAKYILNIKDKKIAPVWIPPPELCFPNERFRVDNCNYCYCNENRERVCDDNKCDPNKIDTRYPKNTPKKGCYVGSRFTKGICEICRCHAGNIMRCFFKWSLCPSNETTLAPRFTSPSTAVTSPSTTVTSPSTTVTSPSTTVTSPSTTEASTNGSRRQMDVLVFETDPSDDLECVVGEPVPAPDSCNVCICLNSQKLCTNKPCVERQSELRKRKEKCVNGKKLKMSDGCNYCVCDGGQMICTSRACLVNEIVTIKHFNCVKGEVIPANDGCNMCVCMGNDRKICTSKRCLRKKPPTVPYKLLLKGLEQRTRNAEIQMSNLENCVDYQPLPPHDACSSCICLHGRKVCTFVPCNEDLMTDDVNKMRDSKGNMVKKKHSFCVPFTFFSPENNKFCRNCFCLHNGLALCMLNMCKYSKDVPHHGEPERGCDERDEFHMGFYPYCAGCKCSDKEWFCSIQTEPCSDYSNVTCPLGTFIRNPRQNCSICLCGGHEEGSHNMCFTETKCARHVTGL